MQSNSFSQDWAFNGTSNLLGLVDSIYATVHDPAHWQVVLDSINQAAEGDSLALFAAFPGTSTPQIVALSGLAPDLWQKFAGYYAAINPIMTACERRLAPDVTWFPELALSTQDLHRSECYTDFYRPNRMDYFAGIRLSPPRLPHANLSCQRAYAAGAFGDRIDVIFRTLRPHLQRALQLHHTFSLANAQAHAGATALDRFGHAVLALDAHRNVVSLNRAAETFLRRPGPLRLTHRRLSATHPATDAALQKLLTQTVAAGDHRGLSAGGSLQIDRPAHPPLSLTATPMHMPASPGMASAVALVFLYDPSGRPLSRARLLQTLFSATASETRIADLLLAGLTVREIADTLSTTETAVRFHIKQLLRKTSVSRQADLVRVLLSLPGD